MHDTNPTTEIEALTKEIKSMNKGMRWHASFFRGIASGFGTAVGAGLVVALVALALQKLHGIPILGQWFNFLAGHLSVSK